MKLVVWALMASLVIYASSSLSNASLPRKSTLEIRFPSSVQLPIGTSVLLEGRRIGFLAEAHSADQASFRVVLEEESNIVHPEAMAVVSSTWSTEKKQSLSFIEILNPEPSPGSKRQLSDEDLSLIGYSDFESFWRNRENQHWVDKQPFKLG